MSKIPTGILGTFLLPSDSLVEFRPKKLKHTKGKMQYVPTNMLDIPEALKLRFYEICKPYDSLGTYYHIITVRTHRKIIQLYTRAKKVRK